MSTESTTNEQEAPSAMPGSSPFDPMCWDHEPRLDGDGVFKLALEYIDCQTPPMMAVQTIHMDKWPDGTTCHRKTFAVLRRTQSGAREHQPMSVSETLWQALLSFCMDRCHIIHYDMRGGHRIRIESGSHDSKQWQFRGASWEQVTKKAVLTMMPGYWTNARTELRLPGSAATTTPKI